MHRLHLRTRPIHPQSGQWLPSNLSCLAPCCASALRGLLSAWCGRTLHGSLRAHAHKRTHGADHEVLNELGGVFAALGLSLVGAERRDLSGAALALEGAVEAGRRLHLGTGDAAGLHGGAAGTGDGQRVVRP